MQYLPIRMIVDDQLESLGYVIFAGKQEPHQELVILTAGFVLEGIVNAGAN